MSEPFKIVAGLSHCDHLTPELLEFVAATFKGRTGFFSETISVSLEDALKNNLTNALYGPASGDPPVTDAECYHAIRSGRNWSSRMVSRAKRPTALLTVIAGPSSPGADDCVMYTAFGGPAAPREVNDPDQPHDGKSEEFWAQHALAE